MPRSILLGLLLAGASWTAAAQQPPTAPTMASVLEASPASDWEAIADDQLLVMRVGGRQILIELASAFAPEHAGNIRRLAQGKYFDGLAVVRVQENYVAQWGDPAAAEGERKPLGEAKPRLPAEFDHSAEGQPFTALPDPDAYAAQTGFSRGFPVGRDGGGRQWLLHCYGMLGAGRGDAADSSNGSELYAVIGHSPRHLDRNITLVGRVIEGLDALSVLPRGSGPLGFYQGDQKPLPIESIRLAADLPETERPRRERLRTDSASFAKLIEARRFRRESWFIQPVGRVEVCNVPLPVRARAG